MPTVLFVDDCPFTRDAWAGGVSGADVRTFAGPEELWDAAAEDPQLFETALALVTDYHFDVTSEGTGYELARAVRARSTIPVVLCSNGFPKDEERAGFDAVIGKVPPTLEQLLPLLGASHR